MYYRPPTTFVALVVRVLHQSANETIFLNKKIKRENLITHPRNLLALSPL